MGLPKIKLSSLHCPRCGGPAMLADFAKVDFPAGNALFSFECVSCGQFEVLALIDEYEEAPDRNLAKPGAESQDLWL